MLVLPVSAALVGGLVCRQIAEKNIDSGHRGVEFAIDSLPIRTVSTGSDAPPTDDASIKAFCGDCHAVPLSRSFPAVRWEHEVLQGIRLYHMSRRDDLVVPDVEATIRYFAKEAPDRYTFVPANSPESGNKPDAVFQSTELAWQGPKDFVAVSSILPLIDLGDDAGSADASVPPLVVTDMWNGVIRRLQFDSVRHAGDGGPAAVNARSELLARVAHPARVRPADMNKDGLMDYVIADLGSMAPMPEQRLAAVWFLKGLPNDEFALHPIRLGGLRIADAYPMDYDEDGDLDLIVGDFGLQVVGGVEVLIQTGMIDGVPQFESQSLDPRPGCLEIQSVDFDGNGKMDFITMIGQNYEAIDLYLNQGGGEFVKENLHTGIDPAFGSSGFELADLDEDGDIDIVYTCGDTFDDNMAKPYHYVGWLENEGKFPLTDHQLFAMPGVYTATTGDIDNDGDLDIAACALLAPKQVGLYPPGTFASIVWLEQQDDQSFVSHLIQTDQADSAILGLMDMDGDGDLDLLAPPMTFSLRQFDSYHYWRNTTIDGPADDDVDAGNGVAMAETIP